jgi:Na+:H+ antiporter
MHGQLTVFEILALLVTVTALLSYLNARVLGLPTTIGVMLGGLLVSLVLVLLTRVQLLPLAWAEDLLSGLALDDVLLGGMLSFLLFAGALQVNLAELLERRWTILLLAAGGTLLSTVVIGFGVHWLLGLFAIELPLVHALLFGALISPTDPVAVISILKETNASSGLRVMVTGESLFNDGVGVVIFVSLLGVLAGEATPTVSSVALLFLREAAGGLLFGLALGYVAYLMLRRVDQYTVEILITLAVVTGGYAICSRLHVSGPLAMVVSGIVIGNHGRAFAMSDATRQHLDIFWTVVDEVLTAVLFLLIGLEIMLLDLTVAYVIAGIATIVIALFARLISVALPLAGVSRNRRERRSTIALLTWGGLRGGIAVALALALPPGQYRDLLLVLTYAVVLFSIVVQGLTVERLIQRVAGGSPVPHDFPIRQPGAL